MRLHATVPAQLHAQAQMGASQSTAPVDYSKCIGMTDDQQQTTTDQKISTIRNRMAQMMIKDRSTFIIGKASGRGGPEARWTDRYVGVCSPMPPMEATHAFCFDRVIGLHACRAMCRYAGIRLCIGVHCMGNTVGAMRG